MEKKFLDQEYQVAQAGADVKEGTRRSRVGKWSITIFFTLAIIISLSTVAFSIVFFLSDVQGSSMMITLNAEFTWSNKVSDSVLVNRYAQAKRGDIIVVRHYDDDGAMSYYIKRLIGIAGDRIYFIYDTDNGCYRTVVNDVIIDESYLDSRWGVMGEYGRLVYNYINSGGNTYIDSEVGYAQYLEKINGTWQIVVPENYVFFMGDNRGGMNADDYAYHSYDCTAFGPQPVSYIEGVVADIIKEKESIPSYVFRKIGDFFTFKWLFG